MKVWGQINNKRNSFSTILWETLRTYVRVPNWEKITQYFFEKRVTYAQILVDHQDLKDS